MPNYVQNRLKVIGSSDEVKELFDYIKCVSKTPDESRTIDFNKITPSPYFATSKGQIDWCYENWGTKWNSYDNFDKRDSHDTIYFKTAWSNVLNLIKQLSARFPKVGLEYSYFDEDLGTNVGFYKIKSGEVFFMNIPELFTKEAFDMALDIAKAKPEDFELVFDKDFNNYTYYMDYIERHKNA